MANFPIRRRRTGTFEHTMDRPERSRPAGSGIRYILAGFGGIVAVGTALLRMPVASSDGRSADLFEALFTAVSAVCVTGLVVVDTQGQWSFFGEAVILVLIQIGGLGYMAGSALALWLFGRRLGLRGRHMLRQYYGAPNMGETLSFVRTVALFSATAEVAGIIALWVTTVLSGEPMLRSLWWSTFHGVSAFNNAGFSVTSADLTPYSQSPGVLLTVTALVLLGSIGALPMIDLLRQRSFHRLDLDYKLIFVTTGVLIVVGTVVIAGVEWDNRETIGGVAPAHRPVLAFFQAAVPRTSGFSAVDMGQVHDETLIVQMLLMFIGGAAGSTAGGIKVGAAAILAIVAISMLSGRTRAVAFGRVLPDIVIYRAVALTVVFFLVLFALAGVLAAANSFPFIQVLFEATSATGTVGLTTGITGELTNFSQALIVVAMLLGRFGPLALVLYMARPRRSDRFKVPEESVRLG